MAEPERRRRRWRWWWTALIVVGVLLVPVAVVVVPILTHVPQGSSGQAQTAEAWPTSVTAKGDDGRTRTLTVAAASGAALDHAFLEQMAKHHQMAISMTESAKLQDPALKTLAQKMIAGQRQELNELKKELSSHGAAK